MTRSVWSIIFIFLLLILAGCGASEKGSGDGNKAPSGHADGVFRHRWWNYYERGLSRAEGKFYQEGLADLLAAVAKRSGDQRMARTYGMHFVDYFPNREIGIVHYERGDLEAARVSLELSLSQFPSAKAQFYLDLVRKAQMEKSGELTQSPALILDIPPATIRTREPVFRLQGTVVDRHYVSSLQINRTPYLFGASRTEVRFVRDIRLGKGLQQVIVTAGNLLGGEAQRSVPIILDQEGPTVTIEEVGVAGDHVRLTGSVYDEAGVASLHVGGEAVAAGGEEEIFFQELLLPVGSPDRLRITCVDILGNVTEARFDARHAVTGLPVRLAGGGKDPAMLMAAMQGAAAFGKPVIRLKDWSETQTVLLDKIFLEGEARDQGKIVSLTVNGESVLRRQGGVIFFNHLVELATGDNTIAITARNSDGQTENLTIKVNRQIPRVLQLAERLSMTVLPFDQPGEKNALAAAFRNSLTEALFQRHRFQLVERDKLDFILQEQKLSQMPLIERKTALQLGRLVAASSVLTGTLVIDRMGVEIIARLVDTETSEILAVEDVFGEQQDLGGLALLAEGLALKLQQQFPLHEGMVLDRKGQTIFTDLGDGKTRLSHCLLFYREEPLNHPLTGKVLGMDTIILGRGRVTQVMAELSRVELFDSAATVRKLDKVIAQ